MSRAFKCDWCLKFFDGLPESMPMEEPLEIRRHAAAEGVAAVLSVQILGRRGDACNDCYSNWIEAAVAAEARHE